MKDKKDGFWAQFKAFISRGNVMDMAVGIVVGSAFTAIVQSFANDLILPFVAIFTGGIDFTDMKIVIHEATEGNPGLFISYGKFIQAIVNFIILSLCVFSVVKLMNKMHEKMAAKELEEKKAAEAKAAEEAAKAAAAAAAAPKPVDEKLETLKAIQKLLEKQAK